MEEALAIQDAGIDAIVAQAGRRPPWGVRYRGADERLGTFALTRLLVRRVDVPVVAAGGIMDGAGIAAALAPGGTGRAAGHGLHRLSRIFRRCGVPRRRDGRTQAVTAMTAAISGRRARGLYNRLMRLGEAQDSPAALDYPIAYDAGKALNAAAKARGNSDFAAQWAGQAVRLSRTLPAGALVAALDAELDEAVRGLGALAGPGRRRGSQSGIARQRGALPGTGRRRLNCLHRSPAPWGGRRPTAYSPALFGSKCASSSRSIGPMARSSSKWAADKASSLSCAACVRPTCTLRRSTASAWRFTRPMRSSRLPSSPALWGAAAPVGDFAHGHRFPGAGL